MTKRYQDCSWYVRLWRRRWLLTVPYYAFTRWVRNLDKEEPRLPPVTLRDYWSLAHGMAHCKMKWWYHMDELNEDLSVILNDD